MSSETYTRSPEQIASDDKFVEHERHSGEVRYIKRHSLQARITHGIFSISCILLVISGLFVFIPPLAAAIGGDAVYVIRMCHRVIGIIFIAAPIVSAIMAPKGAAHVAKSMLAKWDSDDKKWMLLFFPYLFMAKWIHMPDQSEEKSGQRFADGMLILLGFVMAITGVVLLLETGPLDMGNDFHGVMLFIHDIGFFGICVFGMAHIFLGAGIFQPYRRTARLMFGDGMVSESDALYHWAHWARKELTEGTNVVIEKTDTQKD